MDTWCAANCPLPAAVFHARLGPAHHSSELGWRCYAPTALDEHAAQYLGGAEYCTRHVALLGVLEQCRRRLREEATERENGAGVCSSDSETAADGPTVSSESKPMPSLPSWNAAGVLTIPAINLGDWEPSPDTELFATHAWTVPCIDSYRKHRLVNATGNVSRRKAFLKREGLHCYGTCVRGVVDGFMTRAEAVELRSAIGPAHEPGQTHAAIASWRWEVPEDVPIFVKAVARAQAVLEERFGVRNLRFYRSNAITWLGASHEPWPNVPGPWYTRSLHGDLNTDEMFMYTCILYLSDYDVDVHGGETGIADDVVWPMGKEGELVGRSAYVTSGLRVEPALGRLLVFSAGVENMHEMLMVTHGKRVAVQMWFACEGQRPGWAHEQRVAWQGEHGYGGPDGPAQQRAAVPALTPTQIEAKRKPWPWRQTVFEAPGLIL